MAEGEKLETNLLHRPHLGALAGEKSPYDYCSNDPLQFLVQFATEAKAPFRSSLWAVRR